MCKKGTSQQIVHDAISKQQQSHQLLKFLKKNKYEQKHNKAEDFIPHS